MTKSDAIRELEVMAVNLTGEYAAEATDILSTLRIVKKDGKMQEKHLSTHGTAVWERGRRMAKYRKKPVVIEAFRLGIDYIPDWFMDKVTVNEIILHGSSSGFYHAPDTNADIYTLEGWHHANYGDYIIRGVKGEIYPCKPDIFAMTYEEDTDG